MKKLSSKGSDLLGNQQTVFSDLLAAREAISLHTSLEQQLKQRIQQRMGEASRAVFDSGEVTWKRSKDSTAIDTERLQQEYPDLAARFSKSRPGSRRFLVSA